MELTSFQKYLYNFTMLGMKNINIKDKAYDYVAIAWAKIVQTNLGKNNQQIHFKLFERYIDKL